MFIIENDVLKLKFAGLKKITIGGIGHLQGEERAIALMHFDTNNKAYAMQIEDETGRIDINARQAVTTEGDKLQAEIAEIRRVITQGN